MNKTSTILYSIVIGLHIASAIMSALNGNMDACAGWLSAAMFAFLTLMYMRDCRMVIVELVIEKERDERIDDNRDSVCDDCAKKMGYEREDKVCGAWLAKCDFCGEEKALTSLSHDWRKTR